MRRLCTLNSGARIWLCLLAGFWLLVAEPSPGLAADGSNVALAQVLVPSFPVPSRVFALDALAVEVAQRTSIETGNRARSISVLADERYESPLQFMPCNAPISPLSVDEESALTTWLRMGGTLVVDWQGGSAALEQFRNSVAKFVGSLFPGAGLERIPKASVVYRSFYRLKYASGRLRLVDDLYGVVQDERYVILVSFNDMLSAVERAKDGEFSRKVVPGGVNQREDAIKVLVNLVVYALCLDYKDAKLHLDYLKSKRNWRLPGEE